MNVYTTRIWITVIDIMRIQNDNFIQMLYYRKKIFKI